MDLWCPETSDFETGAEEVPRKESLPASVDMNMLGNSKVLERLLATEARCIPSCPTRSYKCVQKEVQIHMRKILANWLMEVSEEMGCDNCVFPLAMNYVDRFLCTTAVSKEQLQLLGSVSLMVAAKLRQFRAIHPEALVFYSDYSMTVADITAWEMLLLTKLKWDVSAVVATDFLDHLLARLHLVVGSGESKVDSEATRTQSAAAAHDTTTRRRQLEDTLRRHAATFVALCATESSFSSQTPSLVATACLAAAAHGLHWADKPDLKQLLESLREITGISDADIKSCLRQVDQVIASHRDALQAHVTAHKASPLSTNHVLQNGADPTKASKSTHSVIDGQPETPTDVQDVHF